MRRIPVIATIRDAYVFTATHLGGIIGLIWVPMVMATVMGFFSLQRYYNDFSDALISNNAAGLAPSLLMMLCYLVAALLLQAIMYVAVVQMALGARGAPAVAHFAFGNLEWRMFRSFVAFIGVCVMLVIPAFVIGTAALKAAGRAADPAQLGLVFYVIIALAMPRFLALMPAIVVGETAPVLRRAWTLSAGNFWRLLAVLLAIFGPIFLVFTGIDMLLIGHGAAITGDEQEQMRTAISRARAVLPLMSGLGFLISPLIVGLFAGASVSAWRTLKEEPAALDIAV
ncbi:MAG TPA: hypothetical protein VHZ32_11770 [Rhizomicrobium sp.]|jgi:hypothetical protein|nr:hypothetical protein [Rhizomicrobium sp.]